MTEVASRELRNQTRAVLERVEAGEQLTITVNGRPAATLVPADQPPGMPREQFIRRVLPHQADPALRDELDKMYGDETTDDLDF